MPAETTAYPTRRMSRWERLWFVAGRMTPPFAIQVVAEGEGSLALDDLQTAVDAVSEANPGCRMQLSGGLGWTRWRVRDTPIAVVEVDGAAWDGRSPDGAPFLARPIDPGRGTSCEVLLVRGAAGQPTRVVLRAHHALMDGVGTRELAFEIFRALRGESLLGSVPGPLTDIDIARDLGKSPPRPPKPIYKAITGATGTAVGSTWRRVSVTPAPGRRILSRTIAALVDAAERHGEGPFRVSVPVDLRRHRPGLRSSANLTGSVLLDGPWDPAQIDADIQRQLGVQDEAIEPLSMGYGRWVPMGLAERVGHRFARTEIKRGVYPGSAIVSNLNRQSLASIDAPGWTPRALFWIPPSTSSMPFFLGMIGHENGLELVAHVPAHLASEGRVERVLADMKAELE